MRHAVAGRKLARTSAHRLALRRNLVQSLIEHGRIRTTIVKAKEVRPFAERLVSLAIRGDLTARRRAIALLNDRSYIPKENRADYDKLSDSKRERVLRSRSGRRYRVSTTRPGVKFTAASIVTKLFSEIGPAMKKRNARRAGNEDGKLGGGYTRLIKLADRRLGDAGQLAILEWVGADDKPRPKSTAKTERKRRAKVRHAFYAGEGRAKPGPRRRPKAAKRPAAATGSEPASGSAGESTDAAK
ncbi:MAG: 50S ribosomal protein L17 [Phycisphaerae bacterium]|nr:50S ribosomal protein L17 [Phycisphaerae bacterium]MCZ2401356.1 50S ribosomal protein L17 [Phycisphaerae bacterium]